MSHRARRRLAFFFERILLRGAHYRLLVTALAIISISVIGGVAVLSGPDSSTGDSIWWAFLRLTDPGYLGDDEGVWRRVVSTTLTVLGYVVFMGALVAIMTQWLEATIERLQRGETPLVLDNHILLLRMTDRTPLVMEQVLLAEERVERFLARRGGSSRLRVVALVEDLNPALVADLRESLGALWDDRQVILRSGSCLDAAHLDRVDFSHAAAILIPGGVNIGAPHAQDAETIKTLLSVAHHPSLRQVSPPPRLVAEVNDPALIQVVRTSYPGVLELVPTQTVMSRMIVQNLRHRGLSLILGELLTHQIGNGLYFQEFPELTGERFADLAARFNAAVALGVVRRVDDDWITELNPPHETRLASGDRLVLMSKSKASALDIGPRRAAEVRPAVRPPSVLEGWPEVRRVLLLGWNSKVVPMLRELESYEREGFEVTISSVVPVEERARALERAGLSTLRFPVQQVVGDFTYLRDVKQLDPGSYDNVALLAREWLDDGESSDAQTILGYQVLIAALAEAPRPPTVLVELMDAGNIGLFEDRPGEVVLSPVMMGHVLAHMALHPPLGAVLEDLFTVDGPEIHFRPIAQLGLRPGLHTFGSIRAAAQAHGETALGVRHRDDELARTQDLELNPSVHAELELDEGASVLVLTTYAPEP